MSQRYQSSDGQRSTGQQTQSNGPTFATRNYLSEDVRMPVVDMLNRTLADSTVLVTQAKFAHWNVKGMEFYGLHQLFDEIAEVLEGHVDLVAERITALGGQARGTAGLAVSNCTLPQMPTNLTTGQEYVQVLADHLATHDANLSEAIDAAENYGDVDTADLLNEVSRDVSQYLWFLEAHLQTQPIGGGSQATAGRAPTGRGTTGQAGTGQTATGQSGTSQGLTGQGAGGQTTAQQGSGGGGSSPTMGPQQR